VTIYDIGTGIADVTDPAIGLKLQGMADPFQETLGVETRLYARAFIVVDYDSSNRVVIVSADIWTGTQPVKAEVIKRLKLSYGDLYLDENVLISGTHTHSGPGGYSGHKLYDDNCGGFDNHNFECIVAGMVAAIRNAHENLAPGRIYINTGTISETCGKQRSKGAYDKNPLSERRNKPDTDTEMLLLKFVALDRAGELPIGTINWYAIHPTDRGQANRLVSGDNKGEASRLFENTRRTDYSAKDTFVAAFANSNCGDVSGNVGSIIPPNVVTAMDGTDKANMKKRGKIQFDTARKLFDSAKEELSGRVGYRHTRITMSNILGVATFPAALGLSFAAGSSEDSIPVPPTGVREGITVQNMTELENAAKNAVIGALAIKFGITTNSGVFIRGHNPKPIVLAPGLLSPPIVPKNLPIQILRIGNLVITAVPGELSTMAGRRLRQTVLDELAGTGVDHLALATYANDYSQYITTKEEYSAQHYEGASTLFGPNTLTAYQQKFRGLARSLKNDTRVSPGLAPAARSSPELKRITIRNLSSVNKKVQFYKQDDPMIFGGISISEMDRIAPARREVADFVPTGITEMKVKIGGTRILEHVSPGMLITIQKNGQPMASRYSPSVRHQSSISTIGRKGPVSWLEPVLYMMSS